MRLWFYAYVAALAACVLLFVSGAVKSPYNWFIVYVAYLSLACNAFPLPTWWIVLFVGRELNHPIAAALLGAFGTMIANLNDYHFFYFWFRYDRVEALRRRPASRKLLDWFDRSPFLMVCAACFLPLPWDFIRIFAIAAGYSRPKFALASFLGRFARYLPLTWLACQLGISNLWIIIIQGIVALIAVARGVSNWRRGATPRKDAACPDGNSLPS